jgi:uncharacterized repeat protein (TIGR01451 family)
MSAVPDAVPNALPDASDAAAARPSRQDLVIPPRTSSWPVAVGVMASAAVGFGLVFFLGIGRSRPVDEQAAPGVATVAASVDPAATESNATHALPDEPLLLPPVEPVAHGASDRWSPRGEGDRYATRTVSHDASSERELAAEQPPRSLSRFSSPDLPPAAEPPAADDPAPSEPAAGTEPEPADTPAPPLPAAALMPAAGPTPPANAPIVPPAAVASPTAAAASDILAGDVESTEPSAATEPAPPAADESPDQVPIPSETPSTDDESLQPPPAASAAAEPEAEFEPAPPAGAETAAPAPLDTVAPRTIDAETTSPGSAIPMASAAVDPPAAAIPVGLPPAPFAAAPPIGPPRPLAPAVAPPEPRTDAPAGVTDPPATEPAIEGQGMPGPLQLEGVQTPHLTVEKRGPKEIQVGQPARFEILVRNVGSATAHEVTLRDEVPRGTSLIATTPPAAPVDGAAKAELVWQLGALPPAGETRVLMELMPEAEGDVGSVASVSFRTDATLRARATKPALVIDCPPPEPVRIGGDVEVTLTVSNRGSGTATGVVLEAFLPETVSHRAGAELEFDVGQLRPGDSKTIELVLGTRSPGRAPARFVARADGGIEIDQPLPLPVTAPTLEVTIDMPARRFLQRPATCTISMVNAGTASARAVELAAQLPAGVKFVRANHAGWHDERTNRVLWNLEELPAGETGTVEVVVMPVQAGGQRITAAARSNDGPSDQAIHVCQVEGLAALAFQVADSEDPIEVEGVTEYVIRVANEGTKAASGVRLAATLVGDLEPVEAEGPGRHRVENLAIAFEPLAKLGPGEEAVYKIRARGRRAGHQRVQVQLVSDDQPTPITKEEVTSVYDDR